MIKPRYRVLRARNFARLESKVQAAMDTGAALIGGPFWFTVPDPIDPKKNPPLNRFAQAIIEDEAHT